MMKAQCSPSMVQSFLSVRLGPEFQLLLSTQPLLEILNLNPRHLVSVPQMPASVVGVCTWKQEVLWIIDLANLLGLGSQLTANVLTSHCSVLVMKTQNGNLGLMVNQVGQVVSCNPAQIQPISSEFQFVNLIGFQEKLMREFWIDPANTINPILEVETVVQFLNSASA
ncbi:MAG: chemotaxis protein CheW [Microcoleaceae cyanobacterium]